MFVAFPEAVIAVSDIIYLQKFYPRSGMKGYLEVLCRSGTVMKVAYADTASEIEAIYIKSLDLMSQALDKVIYLGGRGE